MLKPNSLRLSSNFLSKSKTNLQKCSLFTTTIINNENDHKNIVNNETNNDNKKLNNLRDMLENGPELGDFIGGVVPRNINAHSDYSGKIKREVGERER